MTKISLELLLRVSSRLLVRRQRSYVIHIVTANSAEFSGHGVNTTVDVAKAAFESFSTCGSVSVKV